MEAVQLRLHFTQAQTRIHRSLSSTLSSSGSHAALRPCQLSLQLQGWDRRRHPKAPRARATADFPAEVPPLEDATQTWWMSSSKRRSRQEAQGVPALLVKRSIRQYEELSHPGSVVIMGHVAPGASVKAGGDIIVLGRLAGTAYAGAGGNPDAVVVALTMEPALIGINNRIFSGPDGGASPYPEVASVSASGAICIEPLQGSATTRVTPGAVPSGTPDPVMAVIARQNFVDVDWNVEGLKGRGRRWQSPAVASAITGLYIMLAGILVTAAPLYTFRLFFGVQPISRGWIRLLGILATAFGIYYLGATCGDVAGLGAYGFYASTVIGRTFIFAAFCLLVWAGELPVAALLLGIVNLIGAVTMLLALQKPR